MKKNLIFEYCGSVKYNSKNESYELIHSRQANDLNLFSAYSYIQLKIHRIE